MHLPSSYTITFPDQRKSENNARYLALVIILGSFSNDDGDGGSDLLKKMNLYLTFECRNSVNLFSAPIGLKRCSD